METPEDRADAPQFLAETPLSRLDMPGPFFGAPEAEVEAEKEAEAEAEAGDEVVAASEMQMEVSERIPKSEGSRPCVCERERKRERVKRNLYSLARQI